MSLLREDIGMGDITTEAIVLAETEARAQIIVKEPAVIAGLLEASLIFRMIGVKSVSYTHLTLPTN